jgi:hypothetical protein
MVAEDAVCQNFLDKNLQRCLYNAQIMQFFCRVISSKNAEEYGICKLLYAIVYAVNFCDTAHFLATSQKGTSSLQQKLNIQCIYTNQS